MIIFGCLLIIEIRWSVLESTIDIRKKCAIKITILSIQNFIFLFYLRIKWLYTLAIYSNKKFHVKNYTQKQTAQTKTVGKKLQKKKRKKKKEKN